MSMILPPVESKYFDFLAKFKKESKYFENERTTNGRQWPRIKPVEERGYDNWIAEVVDPVTGLYYTDTDGNSAKYNINMIVRLRRVDGSEVLYSQGQLVGFDSFKDKKTYACQKPEVHIKTNFGHKKILDKKNQIRRVTTGPISVEEVYEMLFTEENADKLWNQKRDRNIQLILKDELNNEPHLLERKGPLIAANDLQGAFNLFKTAPFDYLYNWEYINNNNMNQNQNQQQNNKNKLQEQKDLQEELKKARPDSSQNNKTKFEPEKVK